MRSALFAISAVFLGISLVACSSSKSPSGNNGESGGNRTANPGNGAGGNHAGTAWKLKFKAKCAEGVSAADCIGYYGFTIDQEGQYQVGPGPGGEVRSGSLKAEEKTAFLSLLKNAIGNNAEGGGLSLLSSEEHINLENATTSEDLITLAGSDTEEQKLVRAAGTDLYFTLKSADDAKNLYNGFKQLTATYYSAPFPDACEDGINALQGLVAKVTSCAQDTDCGYFDQAFNPIAANAAQAFVMVDNCSRVSSAGVANTASIKENQTKLLESWGQVIQACGLNLKRADCTQQTGFFTNNAAAVCQQGVCKAPGSLAITAAPNASTR